jgi:LPXTG-motif cell wall-anchored protein
VGVVAGFAVAATISSPANATGRGGPEVYTNTCVSANQARYVHTFNVDLDAHKATASIAIHGPKLCAGQTQEFSLVSYITSSGTFELPQYLFDSQTKTIKHDEPSQSFEIKVPLCFTQVDFVFGRPIRDLANDNLYGDRKVGSGGAPGSQSSALHGNPRHAWFNGGKACPTVPKVEAVSDCGGVINLRLRIAPHATSTTYTIKRGGMADMTVTVTRAERSKTVTVPAGDRSNVTVWYGETKVGDFAYSQPQKCNASVEVIDEHDCDELRITVKNPQGNNPVKASIDTPADATANAEAQVAAAAPDVVTIPGGGSHTFHVPGSANLAVTVVIDDEKAKIVTYLKPAECGGGGGGLPVTGSRTGMLVGGGVGLVAVGAALYVFFRRRRVTFTVG